MRRVTQTPRRLTLSLAALLVAWLIVPLAVTAQQPSTARLTILHTNDTHGHLLPFSYPGLVSPGTAEAALTVRRDIGGIARRATLAARIRTELQARGTRVWLIDAGDFSDGTPFSTEYRGEADVAAMNGAGYDFATIGNHEFNYPLAQTKKLIGLATYSVLCANATDAATGKPLARVSMVEQVGPVRVALFGLLTREAAAYPASRDGATVAGEIETARALVPALRQQADIVVLISHAGEEMDQRLATEVPGIDVIVGGHSHSRLPSGEFVWTSDDLVADSVNGTVIVQAHQWAGELGRLDLLFERDSGGAWHVDRYRARLLPITPDLPDDPGVAAIVSRYWQPIAAKYGEVIGEAAADFSSRGDDQAEYNLFADVVREVAGTEIEFENPGGIRAPLVMGPITRGDLIAMDPFDNTIVTFNLPGREVRRILERFVPHVSGIAYRVQDGQLVEATVNGQPLDDDRIYRGATNSYFAERFMMGLEVTNTGRKRLDAVIDNIRARKVIKPAYDGRRVVVSSGSRRR